jgi:hypothetical protein
MNNNVPFWGSIRVIPYLCKHSMVELLSVQRFPIIDVHRFKLSKVNLTYLLWLMMRSKIRFIKYNYLCN